MKPNVAMCCERRTSPRRSSVTSFVASVTLLLGGIACADRAETLAVAPNDYASYEVTISDSDIRRIRVMAHLVPVNDTLRMSLAAAAPLVNGYATFVRNLRAADGAKAIPLKPIEASRWVIEGARPATIALNYDVLIEYDSVHWGVSGPWARGYSVDGTVFFTGRVAFIAAAGTDARPSRIRFHLPPAWRIATAYRATRASSTEFVADNLGDLWANGNLAGPLAVEALRIGPTEVEFAGGRSMRAAVELYAQTFRPLLETYEAEMHGAPSGKLEVIANNSPTPGFGGGETFRQSISTWTMATPTASTRSQWGSLLAHEMFHLWNSKELPPVDQTPFEWLVEGFTDYMSRLGMLRAGISTEQEFFDHVASAYDQYLAVAGSVSLQDAGRDKGANYALIYFGGGSVAAALDAEMRRASAGRSGVPQLLARLYAEYQHSKQPYDYNKLVAVASELAARDMTAFFSRYVAGRDTVPLPADLAAVGLTVEGRGGATSIRRASAATESQRRVLKAMLER